LYPLEKVGKHLKDCDEVHFNQGLRLGTGEAVKDERSSFVNCDVGLYWSTLGVRLVALWAACGGIVMRISGPPFITFSLTATGTIASGISTLWHGITLKLTVQ